MQNLIIYGNGRIAKIIYHFVKDDFNVMAFTVDEQCIEEERILGFPLLPFENIESEYSVLDHKMLIAVGYVGMNSIREKKYLEAIEKGYGFVNYIHPSVHMHDNIDIGENNIILDNVSLQPYSKIGNSNFIWSNAVVAHGTNVGDTNWITSGVVVSGDAVVKSKCFLGVNATIGHNTILDDETFVGANTLVTKNTQKGDVFISEEGKYFRLDSLRFLQFTGV